MPGGDRGQQQRRGRAHQPRGDSHCSGTQPQTSQNLGEFTLLDSQGQQAGGTGGAGAVKGSREAPRALHPSANTQGVMMAMPSPPPPSYNPASWAAPAKPEPLSKPAAWHGERVRSFYSTAPLRKFSHEAGMKTCVSSKSEYSMQHGRLFFFFPEDYNL